METKQRFGQQNDRAFRARPSPSPRRPSPEPVRYSVGLVAVGLAVAGVLRAAGGALVPAQSHGPVGEHGHAFGDPPAGSEREL